jgi:hypothetical protein
MFYVPTEGDHERRYLSYLETSGGKAMSIEEALLYLVNNLVSTLLAIAAVAALIAKVKPIGRSIKRHVFAELYAADAKHDKRLDNLEMQQLKQIICDRRLPDGERLNAGEEYLKRGGNGEIRMVYDAVREAAMKNRLEERERFEAEEQKKRRES